MEVERLSPKDLYTEAGQQFRYYLSWREKLLAGYFAVMATLAFAFGKMWLDSFKHIAYLVPLLAAALSVIFWLLDRRNTTLYDTCVASASKLETDARLHGPYRALETLDDRKGPKTKSQLRRFLDGLTHRRVLTILFVLAFGASVIASVVAYAKR